MDLAKQLDPLSVVTTVSLPVAYHGAERIPEAGAMFEQARALAPDHPLVLIFTLIHDLTRLDYERLAVEYPHALRVTGRLESAPRGNPAVVPSCILECPTH